MNNAFLFSPHPAYTNLPSKNIGPTWKKQGLVLMEISFVKTAEQICQNC